jgi:hypothetical protein
MVLLNIIYANIDVDVNSLDDFVLHKRFFQMLE